MGQKSHWKGRNCTCFFKMYYLTVTSHVSIVVWEKAWRAPSEDRGRTQSPSRYVASCSGQQFLVPNMLAWHRRTLNHTTDRQQSKERKTSLHYAAPAVGILNVHTFSKRSPYNYAVWLRFGTHDSFLTWKDYAENDKQARRTHIDQEKSKNIRSRQR